MDFMSLCLPLRQQPMTLLTFGLSLSCSLAGKDFNAEGCKAVAAVLDKTQITSLKCASPTPPGAWTLHGLCVSACLCVSSL